MQNPSRDALADRLSRVADRAEEVEEVGGFLDTVKKWGRKAVDLAEDGAELAADYIPGGKAIHKGLQAAEKALGKGGKKRKPKPPARKPGEKTNTGTGVRELQAAARRLAQEARTQRNAAAQFRSQRNKARAELAEAKKGPSRVIVGLAAAATGAALGFALKGNG